MEGTVAWLLLMVSCVHGGGHYMGASLNIQILNQTDLHWNARVHGVLVWEGKSGPCQGGCNSTWVGKSTHASRDAVMAERGDPRYFGTWSTEIALNLSLKRPSQSSDVTSYVNSYDASFISDVNTRQGWVQENVFFDLQLKTNVHSVDVSLSGQSWHHLDYLSSPEDAPYYIQAKLTMPSPRAGERLNSNPMGLSKPLYRVALQGVTEIEIFTQDRDGDMVTCSQAHFVSAGGIHPLPGVSVSKDCRVRVEPALWGNFRDGGMGAVALTLQDFQRKSLSLASHLSVPLSSSSLQFVLETVAVLEEPVLLHPTPDSGQHFIVCTGCQLSVPLYASPPSNSSTEITHFTLTTMPHCNATLSAVTKDVSRVAKHVQYSTVTWSPTAAEVGDYIFLVSARDSRGNEAVARGYHVHVKETKFVQVTADEKDGPYIAFLPTEGSVNCTMTFACMFPIYILPSSSNETVAEATLLNSGGISGNVSSLRLVDFQGKMTYQGEVTLTTHVEGSLQACFDIKTVSGATTVRCLNISQDPCSFEPCGNNGVCRSRGSDHVCDCFPGWHGSLCDNNPCQASPCENYGVCQLDGSCICKMGFSGQRCETKVDLCVENPNLCHRGRCVQIAYLLEGFVCLCEADWTGKHCDIDMSRNHSGDSSWSELLPGSQMHTSVPQESDLPSPATSNLVHGSTVPAHSDAMSVVSQSSWQSRAHPDISFLQSLVPTPTLTPNEFHRSSENYFDSLSTKISPTVATTSMSLFYSSSFPDSLSIFSTIGSEQSSLPQQYESLQASFTYTPQQPSQVFVAESSLINDQMISSSYSVAETLQNRQTESGYISSTADTVSRSITLTELSKPSESSLIHVSTSYLHTSKDIDVKTIMLSPWPAQASATIESVQVVSELESAHIQSSVFSSSKGIADSIASSVLFPSSSDMPSSHVVFTSPLYSSHGVDSLDMTSTLYPVSHGALQPSSALFSSSSYISSGTDVKSSIRSSWFAHSSEALSSMPRNTASSLVHLQTSFPPMPEFSMAITSNLGSSSSVLDQSTLLAIASNSQHLSEDFKASVAETTAYPPSHVILEPSKPSMLFSSTVLTTPSTTTERTTTGGPKCEDKLDCSLLQTVYGDICHKPAIAEQECAKFCGLCKA